jgi:hypothetical protein
LFVGNLNLSLTGSIEIAEKAFLPAFCGCITTGCIDPDPVSFHYKYDFLVISFLSRACQHMVTGWVRWYLPEKISLQYFAKGYRSQCRSKIPAGKRKIVRPAGT